MRVLRGSSKRYDAFFFKGSNCPCALFGLVGALPAPLLEGIMFRRLFVVLVLCGLAYGGYYYYLKPSPAEKQKKKEDSSSIVEAASKAVDAGKGDAASVLEELDSHERFSPAEALMKGAFDSIKVEELRRNHYPMGSADRFAYEVLLEKGNKASLEGDLKAAAKAYLQGTQGKGGGALILKGVEVLRDSGRLDGAIAALGGSNRVFEAKGARDALELLLEKLQALPREEKVLLLSSLIDAVTHGPRVWNRIGTFVEEAYRAEQKALEGLLFSPGGKWHSVQRVVKRNGTLDGIAQEIERKFAIPMSSGILQMVNRIHDPRKLRWKQVIRVPIDPIRVVVEKRSFTLKVFLGDVLFRLYPVGLGKDGKTPATEFIVIEKKKDPDWVDPETGKLWAGNDPRNPLGGFFIKLGHSEFQGFGLHGTTDPSSIGKESSRGCVRLAEDAIRELFLYLPRRTKVQVVD